MGICQSFDQEEEKSNSNHERINKQIIRFHKIPVGSSVNLQIKNLGIDIVKHSQQRFLQILPLQIQSRSQVEFIKYLRQNYSLVVGYKNKLQVWRIDTKKMTQSFLASPAQLYFKTRSLQSFKDLIYFSVRNTIQLIISKKTKIIRKLILQDIRITLIKTNSAFQLLYQTSENLLIWNAFDSQVSQVSIGVLNLYYLIEASKDLNIIYSTNFNRLSRLDVVNDQRSNITIRYPSIQRSELCRNYYFSELILSPNDKQILTLIATQSDSGVIIPSLIKILSATTLNLEWEFEDFYQMCCYSNDSFLD